MALLLSILKNKRMGLNQQVPKIVALFSAEFVNHHLARQRVSRFSLNINAACQNHKGKLHVKSGIQDRFQ